MNKVNHIFLLHKSGIKIILFKFTLKVKKKHCSEGNKDIANRVYKLVTCGHKL